MALTARNLEDHERFSEKAWNLTTRQRTEYHERFAKRYMESLDKGCGTCVLQRPELSRIVADSLLYFDGVRYNMGDFVVMPNHVHLLVVFTVRRTFLTSSSRKPLRGRPGSFRRSG